jgi:hypothetical protein
MKMHVLTSVLLLASTIEAHCKPRSLPNLTASNHPDRFSKLIVNGTPEAREWISIRQTKNYQTNSGVTSVTSPDMRCFQNRAGTSTATVAAGADLGFVAETSITHFGPVQFYMARVPDSADINTWDPSGDVWFKAASISARGSPLTSGVETWPAYRTSSSVLSFSINAWFASLTSLQKSRRSLSRCLRIRHPASTRRKTSAARRCICLVRKYKSRVVGQASQAHLLHFLVRTMRTILVLGGAIIRLPRVTPRPVRECGMVIRVLARVSWGSKEA